MSDKKQAMRTKRTIAPDFICLLFMSVFVCSGWNMASLSDDSADETLVGGGRLHVWRITDLLTNPFPKIVDEFAGAGTNANATTMPSPTPSEGVTLAHMDMDGPPAASTGGAGQVDTDTTNNGAEPAVDMPLPDEDGSGPDPMNMEE
jgi:hypothetical protein